MNDDDALALLTMAEEAEHELDGPDPLPALERLDARYDDLVAALRSFLEQGDTDRGLRMAVAMYGYWHDRGRLDDGSRLLAEALSTPGAERRSGLRARALFAAGMLAFRQGNQERARDHHTDALETARRVGDTEATIRALNGLARVALRDGDLASVRARASEAMDLARSLGDRRLEASPLHMLCAVTRMEGNWKEAKDLYEQSLSLNRELQSQQMIAAELCNLGVVEKHLGDHLRASECFTESLRSCAERGDRYLIPPCLLGLGGVEAERGDQERAARLLAAAEAALSAAGLAWDPDDQPEFDDAVAQVRSGLHESAFHRAWSEGSAMSVDEAVDYATHSRN